MKSEYANNKYTQYVFVLLVKDNMKKLISIVHQRGGFNCSGIFSGVCIKVKVLICWGVFIDKVGKVHSLTASVFKQDFFMS